MKIFKKLIGIVLMIAAPIISGKAFYEYVQVRHMNQKPSYPFGKELMQSMEIKDISYLSNYQHELLSIGVVFLAISILAYISMMVRALVNLVWLALAVCIGYYLYHLG